MRGKFVEICNNFLDKEFSKKIRSIFDFFKETVSSYPLVLKDIKKCPLMAFFMYKIIQVIKIRLEFHLTEIKALKIFKASQLKDLKESLHVDLNQMGLHLYPYVEKLSNDLGFKLNIHFKRNEKTVPVDLEHKKRIKQLTLLSEKENSSNTVESPK